MYSKGLNALIKELLVLPLNRIKRENGIRKFDRSDLSRLAQSIRESGLITPLTVSEENGEFVLVSGYRRAAALELLGVQNAPCTVLCSSGLETEIIALCDNIQRKSLSPFEEAAAISSILKEYDLPYSALAKKLGMAPSTLCNKVRLLSLDKSLREKITAAGLGERHARALLILPEYKRALALYKIISSHLDAAATEEYCFSLKKAEYKSRQNQQSAQKPPQVLPKKIPFEKCDFAKPFDRFVNRLRKNGLCAYTKINDTSDYFEYIIKIAKKGDLKAAGQTAENPAVCETPLAQLTLDIG